MIYRVRRPAKAEVDILDLADWIAKDSYDTAVRFLQAVESTFNSLRTFPERGSLKGLRGRLNQVRSLAVAGFPNHLILYIIHGADVQVLAVVHGARRYASLLRERLGN